MNRVFNLTEGSILKKLILVALPILLTTVSQMLYNLTDIFWISRVYKIGIDPAYAVVAVGTASYLTWLGFGFILIAKIGTSVKISHSAGANKHQDIRVFASNGLLMQLIFGVFFAALVLLFKNQFISIFNLQTEEIINYTRQYIMIVGGLIFINFMSNGFISINEGLGHTRINLIVLAIGFVINMILDPLFILVFRFGVVGAAIATVFSQFITLAIFFVLYRRQNPDLKVFHFRNFNLEAFKKIFLIGIPVGIQSMLFTAISIYIARTVLSFGYQVSAAQRIGVQVEQLTWMIAGGFQTAITVFVGQNIGAKLYDRIRKGIVYISAILIPYSIIISLFIYFGAGFIMRIFLIDPEKIAFGVVYLKIICYSQVFMMIESIGTGVFSGIGKTNVPSANSIIGNLLRIPLVIWLTSFMLERGVWWSLNISSILKGTVMLLTTIYIYTRFEKIKIKKIHYQEEVYQQ